MSTTLARAPWWLRGLFVILGLAAWFWTQSLLGSRPARDEVIGDSVLDFLTEGNSYLHQNPDLANALLISSSAVINILAVFMLGMAIFGPTVRPFLGLLILFVMRQICQSLCALQAPPGMIWRDPGFPGLLVTYDVANDFFFSGHTGLAVLGAIEVRRVGGWRWLPLTLLIIIFEVGTVLLLRAHYFMDVFTGTIAAAYAASLAEWWAPYCDRLLASVCSRRAPDIVEDDA